MFTKGEEVEEGEGKWVKRVNCRVMETKFFLNYGGEYTVVYTEPKYNIEYMKLMLSTNKKIFK